MTATQFGLSWQPVTAKNEIITLLKVAFNYLN